MSGPDVNPVCGGCVHYREEEIEGGQDGDLDGPLRQVCDAYPTGIPSTPAFMEALWKTRHATALPGDRGVHFAPRPPKTYDESGAGE
jgi:hypothetical protein